MFEIKMMNGDIYEVTAEEANSLLSANGLVIIKRLNTRLNFASLVSISPKGTPKTKESSQTMKCHDGSIAVKRFGKWVDSYSGAEMSLTHYPELAKGEDIKLLE